MALKKPTIQDSKNTKNFNKEAVLELAYFLYDLYKEASEKELQYSHE